VALYRPHQFHERHPAFHPRALYNLVQQAEANGLAEAGAVIRSPRFRALLIDEERFLDWLRGQTAPGRSVDAPTG